MSLYRNIFFQALKLTWRNRYFWFLGIFTVFFSTSVEVEMVDNFFGPNNNAASLKTILESGIMKAGLVTTIQNWLKIDSTSFYSSLSLFILFILILALILAISVVGQIIITSHSALFIKTQASLKNQKKLNLWEDVKKNKRLICPVALFDLGLKIIVNLILLLISLPLVFGGDNLGFNWLYVILLIILFPMAIIIVFIIRYMSCYLIIQGQSVKESIINGWLLFKENWLVSAEMSFFLFLTNIIGSLAIIFAILAIANPLWFLGILINQYAYNGSFYFILATSYLIYFALFAWGAALLSIFNITSWTGLFMKLDKNGGESKIVRILTGISKN